MNKNNKFNIQTIVTMGLLIAIEIVIGRFLSIRTPVVTIGLAFIPVTVAAMLYGPVRAGIVAATADFIGAILFPIGAYFPGFTATAFLTGVIYGLFLYKKPVKLTSIILSSTTVSVICSLLINSYWLYLITGSGLMVLIPARVFKSLIMIPIEIFAIHVVSKLLAGKLRLKTQSV